MKNRKRILTLAAALLLLTASFSLAEPPKIGQVGQIISVWK